MDNWLSLVGSGGGLVLLAAVLWGMYKLAEKTIGDILGPAMRSALDSLTGIKDAIEKQTAAVEEQTGVLTQMRVEDAGRHGELRETIERSAKETRHDIRNAVQRLADDRDDPTPVGGIRRKPRDE